MAHLFAFRSKIAGGVRANQHLSTDALDVNAGGRNCFDLFRIVRHQSDRADFEESQNLDGQTIVAKIDLMSEMQVRLDRIEPSILQFVGTKLFHQADTPALLML